MSFSDPAHIIDHIPRDFDMKRITRKRPLEQRRAAKQARQNVEPFSCERPGRVWTLITSSERWPSSLARSSLEHGVTNEDFD